MNIRTNKVPLMFPFFRLIHYTLILAMLGAGHLFAEEKANRTLPSPSADGEKSCSFLLEHVIAHYRELYTYLPKDRLRVQGGKESPIPAIIAAKTLSCQQPEQSSQILGAAGKLLSLHSGKVGLLLPDTPKQAASTQSVLEGMRAYYTAKGADFDKRVIVVNVANDPSAILRKLAELVFVEQVGIVIGGLNELETAILGDWADKLMIPALLLAPYYGNADPKKYVFHIFPRPDDLVGRIMQHLLGKGLKKISLMYPIKSKPSRVVALLLEALPKNGITIVQSLGYSPSDYNSMEMAGRSLLHIDNTLRADEYQKLLTEAKEKAEEEKIEFHPEHVTLPPVIDFDALILPDNFRNVRHFVQIFKFLKVKSALPMIGTQEWRAFGLINPPEPMLDRSVFVDYIGSYLEIPDGIRPTLYSPPFFVNPEDTAKIDYMIIGYQASRMANLALQRPPTKRRKLAERLLSLENSASPYFPPGPAFAKDHTAYWPSFLFEVNGNTIRLSQGGMFAPAKAPVTSPLKAPATAPLKAPVTAPLNASATAPAEPTFR